MIGQRASLAKAVYDLGKLAFAALVLGPVLASGSFHVWVFVLGVIFTSLSFSFAWWLDKEVS